MSLPDAPYEPVLVQEKVGERELSTKARIAVTALMPLFLMATFILSFVSSSFAPTPHDFPLTLAGNTEVTEQIADGIVDASDEDAFTFTYTDSADQARDDVLERESSGAIAVSGDTVTVYVASAAGSSASALVRSIGTTVSGELGLPLQVEDIAAPVSNDAGGTSIFFFLIACTLGTFLTITVMTQSTPKAKLRTQLAATAIAAILAPVIAFAVISGFVGDYGVPFGSIAAVLSVGMIYSFTVGLVSLLFTRLAGAGGTLISMIVAIALSFPSSGGSTPAPMLPPFWQGLHEIWLGSAALEWIRSILYFNGAGIDRWVPQLLTWLVVTFILVITVTLLRARRTNTPTSSIRHTGSGVEILTASPSDPGIRDGQPVDASHPTRRAIASSTGGHQ